jgi:hypothetical protein
MLVRSEERRFFLFGWLTLWGRERNPAIANLQPTALFKPQLLKGSGYYLIYSHKNT